MRSNSEYLIPGLAVISLLTACAIVSSKKILWNDELLSYYLLSDASFIHMLSAFHDKINNTPPLYFLLGWIWTSGFGSTPFSLRSFSSVAIGFAALTTWVSLRTVYDIHSTMIAILTVFGTSPLILDQNAEARMYGLFLAIASLLILQFQLNNRTDAHSRGLLTSNVCINGALVQTHLFGILYSGIFLIAQMGFDRSRRIFRPGLYAVIVLSWVPLLFYVPSFLNQADAGSPRFWLPSPTLSIFRDFMLDTGPSRPVIPLLALLSLVFLVTARSRKLEGGITKQDRRLERSLIWIACAFSTIPVGVFLISSTKPLFLDKYLIPTTLVWTVFIAAAAQRVIRPRLAVRGGDFVISFAALVLLAASTIYPLWAANVVAQQAPPGSQDARYGYEKLPIVVQFSHDFVTRLYYSPTPNRYFFILDWSSAVDESSGLFPPQEYKQVEALKRQYPKVFQNVIQGETFLTMTKQFLVLTSREYDRKCPIESEKRNWGDNIQCPQWVAKRLLTDSKYRVQLLGEVEKRILLFVENKE